MDPPSPSDSTELAEVLRRDKFRFRQRPSRQRQHGLAYGGKLPINANRSPSLVMISRVNSFVFFVFFAFFCGYFPSFNLCNLRIV
jgi:hypothetical protein